MGCIEGTHINAFLPDKQRAVHGARQKRVHQNVYGYHLELGNCLPGSESCPGLAFCFAGLCPADTHQSSPTGQQSHQDTDGRSALSPLLGRRARERLGWKHRQELVCGCSPWLTWKRSGRGLLNQPFLPSFRAGGCPSTSTVPVLKGWLLLPSSSGGELNQNSH